MSTHRNTQVTEKTLPPQTILQGAASHVASFNLKIKTHTSLANGNFRINSVVVF